MRTDAPLPLAACVVGLLLTFKLCGAQAQTGETPLCEYQTVPEISDDTGDVRWSRQNISEHECDKIEAAVGELAPGWRQRLPQRVRWLQRSDSASLCRLPSTEWGSRQGNQLGPQGCVFVRASESCTIVSASALSHAQLANAVRDCTN